jgi:hypothetical protein
LSLVILPVARQGWAEKFEARRIFYRHRKKLLSPRQSGEPRAMMENIDTPLRRSVCWLLKVLSWQREFEIRAGRQQAADRAPS